MDQTLFNIVVAVCGALGGWLLRVMWQSLTELRAADKELAEKVSKIEVLVAGEYVKRDELTAMGDALFKKLDRIEDKLDGKADK